VEPACIALEMTITKADFLRLLPGVAGQPFLPAGDRLSQGDAQRGIALRISELPPMRLGTMALERLRLDIEFSGYTALEQKEFLSRFRLQYQRGGG
jgi:hypothetical protein